MKIRYRVALALLAGSAATMVEAADEGARALAAGCLGCHQPGGSVLPTLHGQSSTAIGAKLRAFRDGTQTGTVMPQLAKGYNDPQIDAIAGWFAAQKAPR